MSKNDRKTRIFQTKIFIKLFPWTRRLILWHFAQFFFRRQKSFFQCTKAMEKKISFQTNKSLKPSFRTCRLLLLHPEEYLIRTPEKLPLIVQKWQKTFFSKNYFLSKCIWTRSMHLWRGRQKKLTQYSKMIEKTYFFPEKKLFLKKSLWTRRMKFDNPDGNSSTKDHMFLLHAQE